MQSNKGVFQNIESIRLIEDELRHRLNECEQKLAEADNRENLLERGNQELKEKYEAALEQAQKLRDELEDARQEAERVSDNLQIKNYTKDVLLSGVPQVFINSFSKNEV